MTTLDSDFAFGKMFRKATAADFGLRQEQDAFADTDADGSKARGGMAALSIFAGLGIMSAVIFTTGYLALLSDTPAIWIHRLMALTVAQSILISAVAMKLLPLIERRRLSVRIITDARAERAALLDPPVPTQETAATAAPLAPPMPVVGGRLAGREFLEHADGTIEIDTLVGRRRFASIASAREFVGS
jgi:hypothetical protein